MKDIDKHTIPSILCYLTTEQRISMWDQIKAIEFANKFSLCDLTKNEPYQDKQTFVTFLAGFSDADLKTLQAQLGFPPDATIDTNLAPKKAGRCSMKSPTVPESPVDAHVSVPPSQPLAIHPLPPTLTRSKRSRSVLSVPSDDDPPAPVRPHAFPHFPPGYPDPAMGPNMPMPQYAHGWGPQYPMPMHSQPYEYMHPPASAPGSSHYLPLPPPVPIPSGPSSKELADLSIFGHYRRYATKGDGCGCMVVF